MNLGEKLKHLIENYQEGDKLKVYFTSSDTDYKRANEHVWDSHVSFKMLDAYLLDFAKYGECAGCDPKGVWIKDIDFELIK